MGSWIFCEGFLESFSISFVCVFPVGIRSSAILYHVCEVVYILRVGREDKIHKVVHDNNKYFMHSLSKQVLLQ